MHITKMSFQSANFADLKHKEISYSKEIESTRIKYGGLLDISNSSQLINTKESYIKYSDNLNILKEQKLKAAKLMHDESNNFKCIENVNKSIKALEQEMKELKEDEKTNIKELKDTQKILIKALKTYSVNFDINVDVIEVPFENNFYADVKFFVSGSNSKSIELVIDRRKRQIIDIRSSDVQVESAKNQILSDGEFNTGLLLQLIKL